MTIEIEYIDEARGAEWDDFVRRQGASSFYHRYAWRAFFAEYFRKETYYLAAVDDGGIVGVVPLVRQRSMLFGDYLVSLPFVNYGGVLADSVAARDALLAEVSRLSVTTGVSHTELRGTEQLGELPCKLNKVAMRLEVPATEDELSRQLGSKLRSQIRRPQREDPEVVTGGIDLVDEFFLVFSRNMRDLGTPVYAKSMFVDLLSRFPQQSSIVAVKLDGSPVAAAFLFHHDGVSEVPWASSDRRYNKISVNMLLYWEILRECLRRSSTVFDFGRSSKDAGTYRFKKQWGAEPVQLCWSYWLADGDELPELNPENSRYKAAIGMWQKLPIWATRVIGPPLARNLP